MNQLTKNSFYPFVRDLSLFLWQGESSDKYQNAKNARQCKKIFPPYNEPIREKYEASSEQQPMHPGKFYIFKLMLHSAIAVVDVYKCIAGARKLINQERTVIDMLGHKETYRKVCTMCGGTNISSYSPPGYFLGKNLADKCNDCNNGEPQGRLLIKTITFPEMTPDAIEELRAKLKKEMSTSNSKRIDFFVNPFTSSQHKRQLEPPITDKVWHWPTAIGIVAFVCGIPALLIWVDSHGALGQKVYWVTYIMLFLAVILFVKDKDGMPF